MSKRPFISQYDSPNILIVPTVNFSNNQLPAKKQKLESDTPVLQESLQTEPTFEQTLEQSSDLVREPQNTIEMSSAEDLLETCDITRQSQPSPIEDISNKNCALVKNLNTTPKRPVNSWASNYLMSIGESYKKPIDLNLSLSRNKVSLPNSVNMDAVSKHESSNDIVLNSKEVLEKCSDKSLIIHKPINQWNISTSTKNEDTKMISKTNIDLEKMHASSYNFSNEYMNNKVLTEKSTKEMILNHPTTYNEYNKLNVHNSLKKTCTETRSQDFNLLSNTVNVTNSILYEDYTNIDTNTKNNSLKFLPNPIRTSMLHSNTFFNSKHKHDYLYVNINNKNGPDENRIKDAATKNTKYLPRDFKNSTSIDKHKTGTQKKLVEESISSDFENIHKKHKSESKSPRRASKISSPSDFAEDNRRTYKSKLKNKQTSNSEKQKYSPERSRSLGKKYRRRSTSDSSATSCKHSNGSEDKYNLYKNRKEPNTRYQPRNDLKSQYNLESNGNMSSSHQPKVDSKLILRNRRYENGHTSSTAFSKIKSPNYKEDIKTDKESCKHGGVSQYKKSKENNIRKLYQEYKASYSLLKKIQDLKTKKKLKINTLKFEGKPKLKSIVKSPRSSKTETKDKLSQNTSESKKSTPIKSKAQNAKTVDLCPLDPPKLSKELDLRTKLTGKSVSLNQYFSKLRNSEKTSMKQIPRNRENLIITIENDVEKTENKFPGEETIQSQNAVQYKQIKLVINVIHEQTIPSTSHTINESNKKENEECAINNEDLSFLDDFNVDEIVESLNDFRNDFDKNEIAKEFIGTTNYENVDESSVENIFISSEDSEKSSNPPDIHDEETMELLEIKENENLTESGIKNKTVLDDQRLCVQDSIKNCHDLIQDQTKLLNQIKVENCKTKETDPKVKMESSDKVLQGVSPIVLEDSNDSDVIILTEQNILVDEPLKKVKIYPTTFQDRIITPLLFHSKENSERVNNNNTQLVDTIKTEINTEKNVFTSMFEIDNNNTSPIDNVKVEPSKDSTISKDENENKTSVTDNIKLKIDQNKTEPYLQSKFTAISKYDTSLINNIKVEPDTEEIVQTKTSTNISKDKEDNMSLINNIKKEPSIEENLPNKDITTSNDNKENHTSLIHSNKIELNTEENIQSENISSLKKSIVIESTYTKDITKNDALVKSDKLKPNECNSEVQSIETVKSSDALNNKLQRSKIYVDKKVNWINDSEKSVKRSNNTPNTTHITEAYLSPIPNVTNLLGNSDNLISNEATEIIMQNSTKDMCITATSEDEKAIAISLNLKNDEMSAETNGQIVNEILKVQATGQPKSSPILSGQVHSKSDIIDLKIISAKTTEDNQFGNKDTKVKGTADPDSSGQLHSKHDIKDLEIISVQTTNNEQSVTKIPKVKATSDLDSSSIITDQLHSKHDGKDLQMKKMSHIASLKCPDIFLVELLEERMIECFHDMYIVTKYIHDGQFSKIFQCKNSSGQVYAAKVVMNNNEPYHWGVLKEKMLMSLQKDIPKDNFNCLYIFNGFAMKRNWCFLTEYYPMNLTQALETNEKPFHIDVVQELSRQLVAAVTVLRKNNVVHSDIKPKHILMNSSNDRLKLCGFDEAYYNGSIKVLPNIGTVNYRAPELILGYSADFSIDVWSTALVMFEMATKIQLFPGVYNNDILFKQISTLGSIPYDMIRDSFYKDKHFKGLVFKRRIGLKTFVYWENFKRNFRLPTTIFSAYNKWNRSTQGKTRRKCYNKLTMFQTLLEAMLQMHPKQRIPIEFVYSSPFIHEPGTDFYY